MEIIKRYFFLLFFVCLIFLFLTIFIEEKSATPLKKSQVCFENNCFNVEVANTRIEMQRGLMFRDSLEKDKGMLFVFNKEDKSFDVALYDKAYREANSMKLDLQCNFDSFSLIKGDSLSQSKIIRTLDLDET